MTMMTAMMMVLRTIDNYNLERKDDDDDNNDDDEDDDDFTFNCANNFRAAKRYKT